MTKINTDKIKNAGEELLSIAKDYNTIINNFFEASLTQAGFEPAIR